MTGQGKSRTLRALCIFLAAIIILCAVFTPQASAASSLSNYENAVLFWTNVERSRHGLNKLKTTDALCSAAGVRANELPSLYSHNRPNGSAWHTVLKAKSIDFLCAAENIAAGYITPSEVVKGWMDSPPHRSSILNGDYAYLGVGLRKVNSGYQYYWDQLFTGGVSYSGAYGAYNVSPKGLSVDRTRIKLSKGGTTDVIGTPSPVYATAVVTCTSSDKSVVKVTKTEVNVITVKGVSDGTATLTVKCGSYTKTISVTVGTGVSATNPTFVERPGDPAFSDLANRIRGFFSR